MSPIQEAINYDSITIVEYFSFHITDEIVAVVLYVALDRPALQCTLRQENDILQNVIAS